MKRPYLGLHRMELLRSYDHLGGFMYSAPILLDGDTDDEPLKSKLVLFEDGKPLRRAHERYATITGTGRGAYSHWHRHVLFSTSDNSDPNANGRLYSFAVDHAGLYEPPDTGFVELDPPFTPEDGLCWSAGVVDEGDDAVSGAQSKLQLYEDERPLGPSHADGAVIARQGSGAYSHRERYLYFSTSDGSDPNTNGRLYRYDIED